MTNKQTESFIKCYNSFLTISFADNILSKRLKPVLNIGCRYVDICVTVLVTYTKSLLYIFCRTDEQTILPISVPKTFSMVVKFSNNPQITDMSNELVGYVSALTSFVACSYIFKIFIISLLTISS